MKGHELFFAKITKLAMQTKTMFISYISRDNSPVMTPLFFHAGHSAKNVLYILQFYGKETVKDKAEPFRLSQKGKTNERSFQDFVPVPFYNVSEPS